jgi:hypothetical protein
LEDGISSNPAQRMARCPSILPKHKSITEKLNYHLPSGGQLTRPSKPDIPPDRRWRVQMKKMILAAFTALSLTAAVAPLASAASVHSGPYDNTANSLGGRNAGTYGGN